MNAEVDELTVLEAHFEPARRQYLELRYRAPAPAQRAGQLRALAAAAALAAVAIGLVAALWDASDPRSAEGQRSADQRQFTNALTAANARPALAVSLRPKVALRATSWPRTMTSRRVRLPSRPGPRRTRQRS